MSEFCIDDDLIEIAIESVVDELPLEQQEAWRTELRQEFEEDRRNGVRAAVYRQVDANLGTTCSKLRLIK